MIISDCVFTQVQKNVPRGVICDICQKAYMHNDIEDSMELQDFLHINFICGCNSVFGDGHRVEADICQHCLKKKMGEYMIITDYMKTELKETIDED